MKDIRCILRHAKKLPSFGFKRNESGTRLSPAQLRSHLIQTIRENSKVQNAGEVLALRSALASYAEMVSR